LRKEKHIVFDMCTQMKKIFSLFFTLVLILSLSACANVSEDFDKVWNEDLLVFSANEDSEHVTGNITLVLEAKSVSGVKISWSSNNSSVISILGSQATVYRQNDDVEVELTAKATIGKKSETKIFKITVLGLQSTAKVKVTYEANGGEITTKEVEVNMGSLLTEPSDPIKEGYTFLGWYKDKNGKEKWDFLNDKVDKALTLYALWEEKTSEIMAYSFSFTETGFGYSYSDNTNVTKTLTDDNNQEITVFLNRVASNSNHSKYTDPFLVFSSSNKSSDDDFAFIIFTFPEEVGRITFDAAYWSTYDVEQVSTLLLQVKNGEDWNQVFDIKAFLNGTLEYKEVSITGINSKEFRIYAEGIDPTGSGSNGGRFLIDNMKVYAKTTGEITDTIPPVISGPDTITVEVNSSVDYLVNYSAIDNVDGDVSVKIVENNVDISVAGEYTLVIEALDKAGNKARFSVKVIVQAQTDDQLLYSFSFTETGFGYSYSDNTNVTKTLTDDNNQEITVLLNRVANNSNHSKYTDPFLVFSSTHSKSDNDTASMEITFPKAVNKIVFDAVYWSEKDATQVEKFVLEIKTDAGYTQIFDIKAFLNGTLEYKEVSIGNFEATVLRIYAEGVDSSSGTNGGRFLIDNMKVYASQVLTTEEQNLRFDEKELNIVTRFLENGNITLPSVGSKGSSIVWSFKDTSDVNNQYLDLTSKAVTAPLDKVVDIVLVAKLTNGEYYKEKTFVIRIGEGEAISVRDVYEINDGEKLKVQGTVTDSFVTPEGIYFFLEDDNKALYAFASLGDVSLIKLGNVISFIGTKGSDGILTTISDVSKITLMGTNEVTAYKLLDLETFSQNEGRYIEISGLLEQEYVEETNIYTLFTEQGSFNVVIPESLGSVIEEVANVVIGKEAGIMITVKGCVSSDLEVAVFNSENLVVDEALNPALITNVIMENLQLDFLNDEEIYGDIFLPTSSLVLEGYSLEWISLNESVISNQGEVTLGDTEVSVTLEVNVYLDDELINTKEYTVIVGKKAVYTDYYSSINGLTGNELKNALHQIISNMTSKSYDDARDILQDSDEDPLNPDNIILVYNRASIKSTWDGGNSWNREHVWPQSKLGTASMSDLHNLKPSNSSINSSRGNDAYADGSGKYGSVGSGWFPGEDDKGDIARIVFYMNTCWGLDINSNIGVLRVFLEWHIEDPVDDFERNRNEVIYSYQKNRNPYIDHPELVEAVYGKTTINIYDDFDKYEAVNFVLNSNNIVVITLEEVQKYQDLYC